MLNGEILFSLKKAKGLASKPVSEGALIVCGFAGIFGFSARLIGGGIGDFGRVIVLAGPALTVDAPGITGTVPARSKPGVGALVGDLLLCCDTRPRTFPNADVSTLSGDREGLRAKKPLGGERGESICTAGVSCGEDPTSIDRGRLWFDRDGDSEPLFAEPGVRGTF